MLPVQNSLVMIHPRRQLSFQRNDLLVCCGEMSPKSCRFVSCNWNQTLPSDLSLKWTIKRLPLVSPHPPQPTPAPPSSPQLPHLHMLLYCSSQSASHEVPSRPLRTSRGTSVDLWVVRLVPAVSATGVTFLTEVTAGSVRSHSRLWRWGGRKIWRISRPLRTIDAGTEGGSRLVEEPSGWIADRTSRPAI